MILKVWDEKEKRFKNIEFRTLNESIIMSNERIQSSFYEDWIGSNLQINKEENI